MADERARLDSGEVVLLDRVPPGGGGDAGEGGTVLSLVHATADAVWRVLLDYPAHASRSSSRGRLTCILGTFTHYRAAHTVLAERSAAPPLLSMIRGGNRRASAFSITGPKESVRRSARDARVIARSAQVQRGFVWQPSRIS
jgi:hypothetical protein